MTGHEGTLGSDGNVALSTTISGSRSEAPSMPCARARAATAMAASAKGRAKTVCGKRTKEAHFLISENIEH